MGCIAAVVALLICWPTASLATSSSKRGSMRCWQHHLADLALFIGIHVIVVCFLLAIGIAFEIRSPISSAVGCADSVSKQRLAGEAV